LHAAQNFIGSGFAGMGIHFLRFGFATIGASISHSTGIPIRKRDILGFNWPRFSVGAGEPVGVTPESGKAASIARLHWPLTWLWRASDVGAAIGVGHPASWLAL
jgi:hypothetical protein